jgi:flagellar biosynthetic protein FliR
MDFAEIARFGLLVVRPGMLIMASPAFGSPFAPAPARLGLTVLLALMLAPAVAVPVLSNSVGIGVLVAHELAIGLALALAIRALVAGAELAGNLTGTQLGLSMGAIINPQSGVRNNLIAALYTNLTLLTFFAVNGHHAFLRALMQSYVAMPIGAGHVDPSIVRTVTQMLGVVFVLGVRLAAPVMVVLLIVEVALGLMTRAAPALNMMAVGTPVRLLVGLIVVAALIPVVPGLVTRFLSTVMELGLAGARAFR